MGILDNTSMTMTYIEAEPSKVQLTDLSHELLGKILKDVSMPQLLWLVIDDDTHGSFLAVNAFALILRKLLIPEEQSFASSAVSQILTIFSKQGVPPYLIKRMLGWGKNDRLKLADKTALLYWVGLLKGYLKALGSEKNNDSTHQAIACLRLMKLLIDLYVRVGIHNNLEEFFGENKVKSFELPSLLFSPEIVKGIINGNYTLNDFLGNPSRLIAYAQNLEISSTSYQLISADKLHEFIRRIDSNIAVSAGSYDFSQESSFAVFLKFLGALDVESQFQFIPKALDLLFSLAEENHLSDMEHIIFMDCNLLLKSLNSISEGVLIELVNGVLEETNRKQKLAYQFIFFLRQAFECINNHEYLYEMGRKICSDPVYYSSFEVPPTLLLEDLLSRFSIEKCLGLILSTIEGFYTFSKVLAGNMHKVNLHFLKHDSHQWEEYISDDETDDISLDSSIDVLEEQYTIDGTDDVTCYAYIDMFDCADYLSNFFKFIATQFRTNFPQTIIEALKGFITEFYLNIVVHSDCSHLSADNYGLEYFDSIFTISDLLSDDQLSDVQKLGLKLSKKYNSEKIYRVFGIQVLSDASLRRVYNRLKNHDELANKQIVERCCEIIEYARECNVLMDFLDLAYNKISELQEETESNDSITLLKLLTEAVCSRFKRYTYTDSSTITQDLLSVLLKQLLIINSTTQRPIFFTLQTFVRDIVLENKTDVSKLIFKIATQAIEHLELQESELTNENISPSKYIFLFHIFSELSLSMPTAKAYLIQNARNFTKVFRQDTQNFWHRTGYILLLLKMPSVDEDAANKKTREVDALLKSLQSVNLYPLETKIDDYTQNLARLIGKHVMIFTKDLSHSEQQWVLEALYRPGSERAGFFNIILDELKQSPKFKAYRDIIHTCESVGRVAKSSLSSPSALWLAEMKKAIPRAEEDARVLISKPGFFSHRPLSQMVQANSSAAEAKSPCTP